MIVKYWSGVDNWGDKLSPILFEYISGITPTAVSMSFNNSRNEDVYLITGSILGQADAYSIVWGPGFIKEDCKFKHKPKEICAVRGPLSEKKLVEQGCTCGVYGDPALLYPRFYTPKVEKKYKLGIIPHYVDKGSPFLNKFRNDSSILIIDIQDGINKVIDSICSCELIASSSLHGIIAADAYGIPSIWIELSSKVVGGGFKFRDYFLSVNRTDLDPLVLNDNTTLQQLYNKFDDYKIDIDLDKLYDVCPFRKEKII